MSRDDAPDFGEIDIVPCCSNCDHFHFKMDLAEREMCCNKYDFKVTIYQATNYGCKSFTPQTYD